MFSFSKCNRVLSLIRSGEETMMISIRDSVSPVTRLLGLSIICDHLC